MDDKDVDKFLAYLMLVSEIARAQREVGRKVLIPAGIKFANGGYDTFFSAVVCSLVINELSMMSRNAPELQYRFDLFDEEHVIQKVREDIKIALDLLQKGAIKHGKLG